MATKTKKFKPHIVHHRHSFKLLPVHHTSYSLVALLLLMTSIFAFGWNGYVAGASTDSATWTVNAKIPAAPLSEAATIDTPSEGQQFNDSAITTSGNCPDASYVSLQRNGVYAGTVICTNNTWSMNLSLVRGANVLVVQAYNYSDDPGPSTAPRTVYYDPTLSPGVPQDDLGVTPPQTTDTSSNQKPIKPPLVLSGTFSFKGVSIGDELIETFVITGGTPPYAISIDWGDGTTDVVSRSQAGEFQARHSYVNPGTNTHNSYVISLKASDNEGQTATLQTMIIATQANGATAGGATVRSGGSLFGGFLADEDGPLSPTEIFVKVATPVTISSAIGLAGFWIGQHRELEILRQQAIRHHRKRLV